MKKLATILLACSLILTGCSKSFKDIKVTSFNVLSITPRGLTELIATVEVGVDNPILAFTVKDIHGGIRMDGNPCIEITSDYVMIDGSCEKTYTIPVRAKLSEEFNPFQLLTMLQNRDLSRFTVDVNAKVLLRSGIGKTFELKDIPMDKLISGNDAKKD